MNHFVPISIILISASVLAVSYRHKFKSLEMISKSVIAICGVWFIYEYAKYLGYDIISIVLSWFKI